MTYETVAGFTQSFATVLFVCLFVGVVVYALWPGNRKTFEHAARLPLDGDPQDAPSGRNGNEPHQGGRNG